MWMEQNTLYLYQVKPDMLGLINVFPVESDDPDW